MGGTKGAAKCGLASVAVFCIALGGGTVATLSSKVMFGFTTTDSDGNEMKFQRPLMQTFLMFVAMTMALPLYYGFLWYKGMETPFVPRRMWFILSMPALTDMLGTMFNMIGLLYVTVSIYQLVRCFVIVFVALAKTFVLGAKLKGYNWLGVIMNATAVVVVSASAFFDPDIGDDAALGIGFILMGCAIMAVQLVLEESFMAGDDLPPLVVVGMEGFWGTAIMLFVIYPIAYLMPGDDHGSYENFYESCMGLWNNQDLFRVSMGYLFAITTYNVAAIFVTFLLESVWRSILENFRPIAVWGADLALFYVVTAGAFGEEWVKMSWLELGGLVVLLAGTATYNGSLRWPGFDYNEPMDEALKVTMTPDLTKSPMMTRATVNAQRTQAGYKGIPETLVELPKIKTTDDLPYV